MNQHTEQRMKLYARIEQERLHSQLPLLAHQNRHHGLTVARMVRNAINNRNHASPREVY